MTTNNFALQQTVAENQKSAYHVFFGSDIPEERVWTDLIDIMYVLKVLLTTSFTKHIFSPEGDLVEFTKVLPSAEPDCIELEWNIPILVLKPVKLVFHSFKGHPEWDYFLLITAPLQPTGLHPKDFYRENDCFYEEATQLIPVRYTLSYDLEKDASCIELSETERRLQRYYKACNFVLFSDRSPFFNLRLSGRGIQQILSVQDFKLLIQDQITRRPK